MEQMKLDYLFVIPTYLPPHKQVSESDDPLYRLKMCELAFADTDGVIISDCEIKRGGKSYTYDTLKELQREDDLIVTASPECTMEEICRRLGIKHCVGSIINEKTGRIERLCMRSRKVPAFLEAFPDAEIENFYTDSPKNDAPLVEMAKNAYAVKGNRIIKIK